ncbi:MAG: flippase [Nitrospinaceae bacterium]
MTSPIHERAETAGRLVKNSIWLFGAEGFAKLIAMATQILAARYLGQDGFGIFSFAFAITGAFIVFIDTGIGVFVTREISRRPERTSDILRNVFFMKWRLSLATLLIMAGTLWAASLETEPLAVAAAIGLALMIYGYTDIYLAVFRAQEQMALVSVLTVIWRILFLVFGLGVLVSGYGVVAFSNAFLAVSVIGLWIARRQAHKRFPVRSTRWDPRVVREIFAGCLPICGVLLFTYIYFRIDAVLLFFLRGEAETGWYAAAFKLIEVLALLMASIRSALFPVLSRSQEQGNGDHGRMWKESARYLFLIGIPLATGMGFLAGRVVDLLYGPAYAAAGPVLRVLALTFPLLCANDLASYLLVSGNRTARVLKTVSAGAVFNLVFNFLVIPRWGLMGAAVAAALTQGFVFLVYWRLIRAYCGDAGIPGLLWRPSLAAGGMGLFLWSFPGLPLVLLVLPAVLIYFLLLAALQTFNEFDFLVLRGIFKRRADS